MSAILVAYIADIIRRLFMGTTWKCKPVTGIELTIITDDGNEADLPKTETSNTTSSGRKREPGMLILEKPDTARSIRERINDCCAKYYHCGRNALTGDAYIQFIHGISNAIGDVGDPTLVDIRNVNMILHKNKARYIVIPAMYKDEDRVFLALAGIDWDDFEQNSGYLLLNHFCNVHAIFDLKHFEEKIFPILNALSEGFGTNPFLLTHCNRPYDVHIGELQTPNNIPAVNEFLTQYGIPYLIRGCGDKFSILPNSLKA